jgi:V8-like Glu-specific endopeptidase
MRNLPLNDPETLARGFGTVSRYSDGRIEEHEAPPAVLDLLRDGLAPRERSGAAPEEGAIDPLFADDEKGRAVVGRDNRVRLNKTRNYPNTAFGVLEMDNSNCSATLIGPGTLITAAHCVYDHDDGGWANQVQFWPGINGADYVPFGPYPYKVMTILSGYISNYTGVYGFVVPWDLAVITLWDEPGNQLGWLGYKTNDNVDFHALNIGYPGDKPPFTAWRDKCDVASAEMTGTEFAHRCDTAPGSSGSAMYSYIKDSKGERRYVEGVNVASIDTGDPDQNLNFGVLLTPPYFHWVHCVKQKGEGKISENTNCEAKIASSAND